MARALAGSWLALACAAAPADPRPHPPSVVAPDASVRRSMESHPHEITAEREARAVEALGPALRDSLGHAGRLALVGAAVPTARSALVVHDHRPDAPYGRLERLNAILLGNVLSHFVDTVTLVALDDYAAGDVELHDATFYLGAWSDDPLPDAFAADALATRRTVVWMYGNPGRLGTAAGMPLGELLGFRVEGIVGLNAPATADAPYPGFPDAVLYKGLPFVKYFDFDPDTGAVGADPELANVVIEDPERAAARIEIGDSVTGETRPWLVQSDNFWFVADRALTYVHARDRYLVLCDVLHDVLGVRHAEHHRALVRLEDIGLMQVPGVIDRLGRWFEARDIPFSMAVIPRFRDPLGRTGRKRRDVALDEWIAHPLVRALREARGRGGSVVMHGTTHQYGDAPNPFDGVSGVDYELFDVVANAPHAADDVEDHLERLREGRAVLVAAELAPFAFEVPHYLASPRASRAIARLFPTTYQRVTYFTGDDPVLDCDDATCDLMTGQFFPFPIPEDRYGQRIVPENLGNLQYSVPFQPKEYLVENARYALAVRDGFASFYFHPSLVDERLGVDAWGDLEHVVDAITELGYVWADPTALFDDSPDDGPSGGPAARPSARPSGGGD